LQGGEAELGGELFLRVDDLGGDGAGLAPFALSFSWPATRHVAWQAITS